MLVHFVAPICIDSRTVPRQPLVVQRYSVDVLHLRPARRRGKSLAASASVTTVSTVVSIMFASINRSSSSLA
jgi:hypothetical protein